MMHTIARDAFLLALLVLAIVSPSVPAQNPPKSSALPIDVTTVPTKTTAGGSVTIRGSTALNGPQSKVAVSVKPPGTKPAVQLSATPKSDGSYSAAFTQTTQVGTYQVTATSPDGKTTATATFQIVAAGAISQATEARADTLASVAGRALDVVETHIKNLPVSPERDQAQAKLATVRARVAQLPGANKSLRQAMDQAFKARAQDPEPVPEWDGYLERVDEWSGQADKMADKVRSQIPAASAATVTCAQLDVANEMLTMVSETMGLISAPFDFSVGFWLDKIIPGINSRGLPPGVTSNQRFALTSGMKAAAAVITGGPVGVVKAIPGLISDFGQFLAQQAFDKYCEKFEGPITGTYIADVFTSKGVAWWSYRIDVDGKVFLAYGKNAPAGKPVTLIGYFEGAGKFQMRDNPKVIGELIPGTPLFHTVKSPPGGAYWSEFGQAGRSMLGNSFRIPLKAVLAGDSIVLSVQPATYDFASGMAGHMIWVAVPWGGMIPEVIDSKVEYQKAQPMIERVVRRHPVMKVTRSSSGSIADATFARDTTIPDKTIRVRTTVKVKACNPSCVPLPMTPGSKP